MIAPFGLLVLALLLSFSRGAWGNLLFSGALFFVLTLATSTSARQTMRLIGFGILVALVGIGVIGVALSNPKVSSLFEERASLTQSYDIDPEHGRFEGQARAFRAVLERPLGLGPSQWAVISNLDTHNVYLHVLVAGGFLSGIAFIAFLLMTLVARMARDRAGRAGDRTADRRLCGLRRPSRRGRHHRHHDNWRRFYLLTGLSLGASSRDRGAGRAAPRAILLAACPCRHRRDARRMRLTCA